MSVAACNFCHTLIEGDVFDDVYSILPPFVGGNVEPFEGLVLSSWRKTRYLRKFAPVIENIRLFFKIPNRSSVWYYNCTPLNFTLICLLKWLKPSVRQQIIMLDYTPCDSRIYRFLLRLANSLDGMIKLANPPLFTLNNSALMPGVVPAKETDAPTIEYVTPTFLLSGVLSEQISMIAMIVDSFKKLPLCTLHITGRTSQEEWLRQVCHEYPNIIFHGMTNYAEYLDILHSVSFVLSTRDPRYPENQCNFPSKIIESLLHNRIVISTIHYPQLNGINYIEISSKPDEFNHGIQQLINCPHTELLYYANQSKEVTSKYNTEQWRGIFEQIELDS